MVISIALVLLAACTYNVQITQKDTASWMNAIYNAQYADYLSWFEKDSAGVLVLKPGTPEAQRQVLADKKKVFTKLHPLLLIYSEYVNTGIVPAGVLISDVEAAAVTYINELIQSSPTWQK
jgi:hypothetical protein